MKKSALERLFEEAYAPPRVWVVPGSLAQIAREYQRELDARAAASSAPAPVPTHDEDSEESAETPSSSSEAAEPPFPLS